MDFEITSAIYNYFQEKKENKEDILYVIKTENIDYVVNRKLAAIMLVSSISPQGLLGQMYAEVKKEGVNTKENKPTTQLSISKRGQFLYETLEIENRSRPFFAALQQLNEEESPRRYKQERRRIMSFCLRNGVKSIDKEPAQTALKITPTNDSAFQRA